MHPILARAERLASYLAAWLVVAVLLAAVLTRQGLTWAEALALLTAPDLAHLWKEDETIGWIYQFFNSKEEREAMRKASSAPRNTRELPSSSVCGSAVRSRYGVTTRSCCTLRKIGLTSAMRHAP